MKYVVITKTNADTKGESSAHLPADWPTEAKEFDSAEAAAAAYPERKIYSLPEYLKFSQELAAAYLAYPPPKKPAEPMPWWAHLLFWRRP